MQSGGELLVTSGTVGGRATVSAPHVEAGGIVILEQSVASGATIEAGATVLLHPASCRARHEAGTVWDALGYAPLRLTGPEVARVQARLAACAIPQSAAAANDEEAR